MSRQEVLEGSATSDDVDDCIEAAHFVEMNVFAGKGMDPTLSRGKHSEHLGYILAEMQVLAREHPGASW